VSARRSLSNTGGACERRGDERTSRLLEECFRVDPDAPVRFTHGFHPYPARMHPDTASRLIERFGPGAISDPFMGSGTVALEAVRAGLAFSGVDVSRVAVEIAWCRTRVWVPDRGRAVERSGHRIASDARTYKTDRIVLPPWARPEKDWFDPHTLREIVVLKTLVEEEPDAALRRVLIGVLSSIVVRLSRQSSDSVTIAVHGARAWPPGAAYTLFRERSSELTRSLLLLSSDLHKRKIAFVEPDFRVADARTAPLPARDLVITSPPYPGVYDYARQHRLRYPLYGDDGSFAEKHEIGSRRAGTERYAADLAAALKNALAARMCIVLGDNAGVRADRLLKEVAPTIGARVVAGVSQERTEVAHGRRGRFKREHLVLLERT
jgi:hypothetical protein